MTERKLNPPPEHLNISDAEWRTYSRGKRYRLRNLEKCKTIEATWRANNRDGAYLRTRKSQLKHKFGITEDDYQTMLKEQNGACAICRTTTPTGRWKVFAVDHCHKTGNVRGLLCNECNRGIGLLRDSAELLRNAAEYLDKSERKNK